MSNDNIEKFVIHELDYKWAHDLAQLYGVMGDLTSIIDTCDLILDLLKKAPDNQNYFLLLEHLWCSVIIKYFRCFNTGKRNPISAPLDEVYALITDGDAISLHNYFKNIRDKHIAHSVNNHEILKIGVSIRLNDLKIMEIWPNVARRTHEGEEKTRHFQTLVRAALHYAEIVLKPELENKVLEQVHIEGVQNLMQRPSIELTLYPIDASQPREGF